MNKIVLFLIACMLLSCTNTYKEYKDISHGKERYDIIPKPNALNVKKGAFIIDDQTIILGDSTVIKEAKHLGQIINNISGKQIEYTNESTGNDHTIRLELDNSISTEEGYVLHIEYDSILLKAKTTTGLFYGTETLKQLLKPLENTNEIFYFPATTIEDAPRFAHRGMMLDTGRYFYEVDFIKRFIDLIALHKMNVFHWHLTEDQGWRIEIKKYPKLTEVGAWRNSTEIGHTPGEASDNEKHGGFYTQEQIKEIVAYAADKHVTIIPEIDMPGHNGAAIAAYPYLSCFPEELTPMRDNIISDKTKQLMQDGQKKFVQESWGIKKDVLCAGKESTYTFYENVLSEVMQLFPSQYIHIGGDECKKDHWERCENCQKKIAENDLEDEEGLQSFFIHHMEEFVNNNGKKIIGWDEILEGGLAPNATVMSWRGVKGGIEAAQQGQQVIMTPREPYYLDYYQVKDTINEPLAIRGTNTVKDVYTFDPLPEELTTEQKKHIIGIQGNLWTEYIETPDYAEYMLLPRMTAIAEVAWTDKENTQEWDDFKRRLHTMRTIYDKMDLNYAEHVFK